MSRPKSPNSIDARILAAVRAKGRGAVFSPADFLELGSRTAVDVTLHRLMKLGKIRRLARGVYDLPRKHPTIGQLLPSPQHVAKALAGRDRTRLQPAGAFAANALGLTETCRRPAHREPLDRPGRAGLIRNCGLLLWYRWGATPPTTRQISTGSAQALGPS